ncbi:MAG: hypothetical protein K9N23_23170 [Akkermansiaceae bacterium]|nr:hypothetical protein [Akkermansiaceae bacterium]
MSTAPPPLPQNNLQPVLPPSKSGIPLAVIIIGGILLVVFIIAALAGLATPQIIKMRKKGDQVNAMSKGRVIAMLMHDFPMEYGSFPDRETAKQVSALTDTSLDLTGDTANDYFRQFIAVGFVKLDRIRPDHQVDLGNSKTLLDTGANTIWGTAVTPVIKPPKVR